MIATQGLRQYFYQSRRSRLQSQIRPASPDPPCRSRSASQLPNSPADAPYKPTSIFLSVPQIQSQISPADPPSNLHI